ncbi:hypothetical protein [Mangrovibacterium lignilyticum]|uniref:hypothetical protein n=1 Tax=Mangrovibacterium lignilyticum TaxID=2668052 RepID=UPI0013D35357|nr:hypothetical protein [Mangrovibacterium lignilyticum]
MNRTIERIETLFSGAAPYEEVLESYYQELVQAYGLDPAKNIAAFSLCPDELNNPVMEKIRAIYGHAFALGGITGYPFTGETGFNAFGDHIPDAGTAFIFYGPHMGIDNEKNGYLHRPGQQRNTLSCGAAIGAYQQLLAAKGESPELHPDDYQQWRVKQMILPHMDHISPVTPELNLIDIVMAESHCFVLRQANRIKALFKAEKIFLLGGVVLNTPPDLPDYIQVKHFDVV